MEKLLWAINVYSRVNHLRVQQEMIRRYFKDTIDVLVITNNEDKQNFPDSSFKYKENTFVRLEKNSGSHTGCLDAYNYIHDKIQNYRGVVWTHADTIFSDYGLVDEILGKFVNNRTSVIRMELDKKLNGRHEERGIVPYIYNDFFVMSTDLYSRVFPFVQDCNSTESDPVEVALGGQIHKNLKRGETNGIIPCFLDENDKFWDAGRGKIFRQNDFLKFMDAFRYYAPGQFLSLKRETRLFDELLYDRRDSDMENFLQSVVS